MRILWGLIALTLCFEALHAQTNGATTTHSFEIPSPPTIHGIGFSRMSNYNPDRSYNAARESSTIDLESSILTSVLLEYYGTEDSPTRLRSEFAISDTLSIDQIITVDSAHVEDWAVYYISANGFDYRFPDVIVENARATSWTDVLYAPQNMDGEFWIAAGSSKGTQYNPNRGWTRAKQQALTNLSEYLNTSVQSLERLKDQNLETIHYVTSKHIFQNIGVIGRKVIDDTYFVLVIVEAKNIIALEN